MGVREFLSEETVELSAEQFWALRADQRWDAHVADLDGQVFHLSWAKDEVDAEGNPMVRREVRLTFRDNPVPKALRGLLKDPDFAFLVKSSWRTRCWDEAHAMDLETILPVFSDRISIKARQWAEPISDRQCKVCARVKIGVSRMPLPGIAGTVERGIEKGMRDAYAQLPARALAYALKNPLSTQLPPMPDSVAVASASGLPTPQQLLNILETATNGHTAAFGFEAPGVRTAPFNGAEPPLAAGEQHDATYSCARGVHQAAGPAQPAIQVGRTAQLGDGLAPASPMAPPTPLSEQPFYAPYREHWDGAAAASTADAAMHLIANGGGVAQGGEGKSAEAAGEEAEGGTPADRIALLRQRTAALREAVRAAELAADAQEEAFGEEAELARRQLQAQLHAEESRSVLLVQRVRALEAELRAERRLVGCLMRQMELSPAGQSADEARAAADATSAAIADTKAATMATAVAAAACAAHDAVAPSAAAAAVAAAVLEATAAVPLSTHSGQPASPLPRPAHSSRCATPPAAKAAGAAALTAPSAQLNRSPPSPEGALTPSAVLAGEGGERMSSAIAASHLPEVLRTLEGGAFAEDVALRTVQLGTQELVCSDIRLLHLLWSARGDEITKSWNVAWGRIKGLELQREKHRVLLLLFSVRELPTTSGEPDGPISHPTSRPIQCHNSAAARLVYNAIQAGRALHAERSAMLQLAASQR
jgi:hypothetical protein